jgi:hypothetical protein
MDGAVEDAPANIIVGISRGKPTVLAVGEDEATFCAHAEAVLREAKAPPCVFVRPGGHAWWDYQHRWPRERGGNSVPAPADDCSALITYPLRERSWSPYFASAMFTYHLSRLAILPGESPLRSSLRPSIPVLVKLSSEFDDTERGEIADVLRRAYSTRKLTFETPVPPRLRTRASSELRVAKILWYSMLLLGMAACVTIPRVYPHSRPALFAPLVLMIIGMKILKRRFTALAEIVEGEAPRRSTSWRAESR